MFIVFVTIPVPVNMKVLGVKLIYICIHGVKIKHRQSIFIEKIVTIYFCDIYEVRYNGDNLQQNLKLFTLWLTTRRCNCTLTPKMSIFFVPLLHFQTDKIYDMLVSLCYN